MCAPPPDEDFFDLDLKRLGAAILIAALEDLSDPSERVRASAKRFFFSTRGPQVEVRRWILSLCNLKQSDLDRLLSKHQTQGDSTDG